ncbi:MAG: PAS domain S-box protein [Methanoregula sp.]|jgi:PAS domain S-box-containing protein|uniref:PAS domain-containing protein n=1 Tax=Methanoregula sp. TaxID=2052170 RepID=UPI003D13B739
MIKILYVDDEPVLLDACRRFLERTGLFLVETALSGEEALQKVRTGAYDAIISDYQMADIDGLALLKIIRDKIPDLPFLIFTGKGREEVAVEAFEHGVDFYVQKGGDPKTQFAELAHKVQKAVESHTIKRELSATEEKFQNFVRNFEGIAFQMKTDGTCLFLEGKIPDIIGYTHEDILSGAIPVISIIHPDDETEFQKEVKQLGIVPGFIIDSLIRIVRKDRGIRWLHAIIHNICDNTGTILYIQGALYDITELKTAQDEIAKTEAKWRSILTKAPATISVLDRKGNVLFLNKSHPPKKVSDMVGTTAHEFLAPDQEQVLQSVLDRAFSLGEVVRFESSVKLGDTVTELLSHQVSRILWDGEPAALVVSMVTTERKWLEQNLRESEEIYRAIVSASGDGIAILDKSGLITFGSPKIYDIFDIPREKMMTGVSALNFVDPAFRRMATQRITKNFSGDSGPETYEYLLRKDDGTPFWGELIASPLLDDAGNVTGLLVLIRDITKRKNYEKAIADSEKKYRTIIENMQDMFYRTDLDGNILMISPHGAKLAGYDSPDEMIGLNTARDIYMDPDERERFVALLEEKGSVTNYITTLKTKNGRPVVVSASSQFCFDDSGKIVGVEGILHDITDLKRTEDRLRESESRFRAIFESAEDAIFIKDAQSRYTLVNPTMEHLFSKTADQLLNMTDTDLFGPGIAPELRVEDQRVLRGEVIRQVNTLPINGEKRKFHIVKVPILDDSGIITGICGISREINGTRVSE